MKPIKLEKFRPQARAIAEMMWGRGGTTAYKVNRNGAYYFSCAGHGGYLVASTALTEAEIEKVHPFGTREYINILVQDRTDGKYVTGVDNSPMSRSVTRPRRFTYDLRLGQVNWERYYIYVFEEDCAWSIIEKFTDIRMVDKRDSDSNYYQYREEAIESTFQKYFGDKQEK